MAGVQSIERAFAVLRAMSGAPRGLTEIAARTDLPKSTVARLLGTLELVGAARRLDETRWTIGPFLSGLAGGLSAEAALVAAARPVLERLSAELGEDTGLSLPDGHEVRYVLQVGSGNEVQVRDWTGTRAPMHATPSGLVFLAEWPPEAISAYVAGGLERLTPRTIADERTLRRRLSEARRTGHAWGREEYAEGITSVAAPVRDAAGRPIAALHVHGPAYRFPAIDAPEVAEQVADAARSLVS